MAYLLTGTTFRGYTDAGAPLVGGKLWTYVSGTTTPQATYTDKALTTPQTNPVILDARGEAEIWPDPALVYTFHLTTPLGATVGDDVDGVQSPDGVALIRLAGTGSGQGASQIGVQDVANDYTETTQEGVNIEIGAVVRNWATVTDPRFGGLTGGSWHTAFNAAAAYAASNGMGLRLPWESGGYTITDTCTVPANVDFEQLGTLNYSGTRDRPALVIGATGTMSRHTRITGLSVRSGTVDWTSFNASDYLGTGEYIGVLMYNHNRCHIQVRDVSGFVCGLDCHTDLSSSGWAYNTVIQGFLTDNKYAMRLRSIGANCFPNENTFYGGRYGCSSSAVGLGDAYGVLITTDGNYRSHNNNRWVSPTFELLGAAGVSRIPFYLHGAGTQNKVIAARGESSGGVFAICDASSAGSAGGMHNEFEVTYFGGSFATNSISQINGAVGNVYRGYTPGARNPACYITPDLAACLKPNAANAMYLLGPWTYYTNGSATVRKITDSTVEATRTGVRISSSASVMGVEVDTTRCQQWLVRVKTKSNTRNGRLVIRIWGATDTQLTTSTLVSAAAVNGTAAALATTANFGGAWQSSSDGSGSDRAIVVALDSTVARMHVGVAGGSNPALLDGIEISPMPTNGDAQMGVRVFSSVGEDRMGLSTAIPSGYTSFGWVHRGEVIGHLSAAVAAAAGWVPVTAAASGTMLGNAPAWVTATTYTQYQIRSNAGNLYEAQGDGTSGATAPTGTGSVSDGTVPWKFVGTVAAYGVLPVLA